MSYNTVVLGAGSWGTALSIVLSENNQVTLWNAFPDSLIDIKNTGYNSKYLPNIPIENVKIEFNLAKSIADKDIIVLAIPSKYCKDILIKIAPLITKNQIIVSATKGLELNPFRTITDLIQEIIPNNKAIVALSGPSHAEETGAKKFTCLVAASHDNHINSIIQSCFSTSWTRIYTNNDPLGVELGAALKNIIAIAAGIVTAANYGDNALAAIITRGITEMTRFGVNMGGQPTTFSGLTGLGDLIVTCYSSHSRNRYVGQQIVLGKNIKEIEESMIQVPEGVRAVKQIHQYAKERNISVPIIDSVYYILYKELSLEQWKDTLIERPTTNEDNFT